jgi:hypothetical protein
MSAWLLHSAAAQACSFGAFAVNAILTRTEVRRAPIGPGRVTLAALPSLPLAPVLAVHSQAVRRGAPISARIFAHANGPFFPAPGARVLAS